jgi:hypothetical protein
MTTTQAEAIVADLSDAHIRNLASFRAGHDLAKGALKGLEKKGTVVQLEDGRWCAILPVLDAFNRRYPRP